MSDVIDQLAGTDAALRAVRRLRPAAVRGAQDSFAALLEDTTTGLSLAERYAVAAEVARLVGVAPAVAFYEDLAADEEPADPQRLAVALGIAQVVTVRPKDAGPELLAWGATVFTTAELVSLYQLISFLAFQIRLVYGLRALAGTFEATPATDYPAPPVGQPAGVLTYPDAHPPTGFVRHPLAWLPWLEPLAKDELTAVHLDALVEPSRADWPYFRLLAHDPAALKARTLTDFDIFFNTDGGIGRAERELAATVVSLHNRCEFCTSVHAARAVAESTGREADVDALLQDVHAQLGDPVWSAIRDFTLALSTLSLTAAHVAALRGAGLREEDLVDVLNAAAFFHWANRLMLTLGQPELPERYR